MIFRTAFDLHFQPVKKRFQLRLLHSRCRKDLAVVDHTVKKAITLQLPVGRNIFDELGSQDIPEPLLIHPDGIQSADLMIIFRDLAPCMKKLCERYFSIQSTLFPMLEEKIEMELTSIYFMLYKLLLNATARIPIKIKNIPSRAIRLIFS